MWRKQFSLTNMFRHPIRQQELMRQGIKIQTDWPEELQTYLSQPLPDKSALLNDLHYQVLDFETSGVDPEQDHILTIGTLPINHHRIDIQQGQSWLINHGSHICATSAVVNHIVPNMLRNGDSIHHAMKQLLQAITGKIVVVHGKVIEQRFVDAYCQHTFGLAHLPCIWLDTLLIEKHLTFHSSAKQQRSLQLADVRSQYGLPNYPDHHAMVDTLACAELFLVQQQRIFTSKLTTAQLKDLYV